MNTMTAGRRTPTETESGADRIARREAHRAAAMEEARVAAKSSHKGDVPMVDRVKAAAEQLEGSNVAQAIDRIRNARPEEQEFLLIAEREGKARKSVLDSFPKPRASTLEKYEHPEGGLAPRSKTPPSATASEDSARE